MRPRLAALLIAGCVHAAMATSGFAGVIGREFFGLHVHRPGVGDERGPMATWPSVPFGALRLWDAKVAWPDLEPEPGRWSFGRLDRIAERAEREEIDLLLPLGLTPAWAASKPTEHSAYRPGWASPPRRLADWRHYVETVSARYGDRILNYEIWNEPNDVRFYSGTMDEYVALVGEARKVLKARNPRVRVIGPSVVGDAGIQFLDAFLSKGGGGLVDVISVHGYVKWGGTPELARDFYRQVRAVLAKHGRPDLPIWNTECGFQIRNTQPVPTDGRSTSPISGPVLSPDEAANFVVRTFAIAAGEGVERVYWYAWDNLRFGLVEPDGVTEKRACDGFRFSVRHLLGASRLKLLDGIGAPHELQFADARKRQCRLLWTSDGAKTYRVGRAWTRATLARIGDSERRMDRPIRSDHLKVDRAPVLLIQDAAPAAVRRAR